MTEHISETMWFAIKLPNGKLCADLGGGHDGDPAFTELPDGTWAYTWSNTVDAAETLVYLSLRVNEYGLTETFRKLAKVVQIRVTTRMEILDTADDPVVEAEVEGLTIPRTWNRLSDIPVGATFATKFDQIVHPANSAKFTKQEEGYYNAAYGGVHSATQIHNMYGWVPEFVEVLP